MITLSRPEDFVEHPHYLTQPLGGDTFLVSPSGLAYINFTGPQTGSSWRRDSVEMFVDLSKALNVTGRTPRPGYVLGLALQQWTLLVTPNAFSDVSSSGHTLLTASRSVAGSVCRLAATALYPTGNSSP